MADGVKFCNRCGAAMTAVAPAAEPVQAAAQQTDSGSIERMYLVNKKYEFKTNALLSPNTKAEFEQDSLTEGSIIKNKIPYNKISHITTEVKLMLGYNLVITVVELVVFVALAYFSLMADAMAGCIIGVICALATLIGAFNKSKIITIHTTDQKSYNLLMMEKQENADEFIHDLEAMTGHKLI